MMEWILKSGYEKYNYKQRYSIILIRIRFHISEAFKINVEFLLIDSMYTILHQSLWGVHDKANQVEVSFTNFCNFYYLLMWTTWKFYKNMKYERTKMSIWTYKIKQIRIWWQAISAHNLAFKKRFLIVLISF